MKYMKLVIGLHCYIVDDCLFDWHSCFEEHGEVPDLVGELVAEDGDGGGETGSHALAERRTNSDTVSEAVKTVSQQHHPGWNKSKTHGWLSDGGIKASRPKSIQTNGIQFRIQTLRTS